MSKRFIKKEYSYDWWFVFDKKQEYCEDMKIPFYDVDNLIAMSEEQVVELLNDLSEENEQLRFDFKEMKGLLHSLEEENEQLKQNARRLHSELMMRRGY